MKINSISISNRCSYSKEGFRSGMATIIFSNEELNDIIKIVKSHEDSGLLRKGISEIVKKEIKEEKGEFLDMLAAKVGASFLSNVVENVFWGKVVISARKGTVRAGKETNFELVWIFNAALSLASFEIQNFCQKEPKSKGVYLRNKMPEI